MLKYLASRENIAAVVASMVLAAISNLVFGIGTEDLVWWLTVMPASILFGIMAGGAYNIRHLS